MGDLRVSGRYQLDSSADGTGAGLNLSVRLPTAPNDVRADDGLEPDKSVQPGAGSVDLIVARDSQPRAHLRAEQGPPALRLQQPVYQYYEGAQVVPDWAAAVGLSYRY